MGKVRCLTRFVSLTEVVVLSRSGKVCPSVRMGIPAFCWFWPCYSASVIDNLKYSLQDREVLAYFYCDFRNERSTGGAEVLRSLLSQLLQQFHRQILEI